MLRIVGKCTIRHLFRYGRLKMPRWIRTYTRDRDNGDWIMEMAKMGKGERKNVNGIRSRSGRK